MDVEWMSNVVKTMSCLPLPESHHHKYIGAMFTISKWVVYDIVLTTLVKFNNG